MAAVQIIECDYYVYFVSNAGSVISSKSPSRAGNTSLIMNTILRSLSVNYGSVY